MRNAGNPWNFAAAVVLAACAVSMANATMCHGKDIGNGECCGMQGNEIYWCPAGSKCDGLIQCTDDGDANSGSVFTAGRALAALFVFGLCACAIACCCRRCLRQVEHQPVPVHSQQLLDGAAVVVVATHVIATPSAEPPQLLPEPVEQPSCPYAPASDVYGYDYAPAPAKGG
jgi:hypothetical protein